MRLLGHPGSDLDETWWNLFPGVSQSWDQKNSQKQKKVRQHFNRTISTLRRSIIVQGGLIRSTGVVLVVLVLVFLVPGVVLVIVDVVASHYVY